MTSVQAAATSQWLTFFLAADEHGVEILKVREVLEYQAVSRFPGAPPWLCGVVNLRGAVIPVVDLAVKLGLAPSPLTHRTCILVVEVTGQGSTAEVGLVIDAVSRVVDLAASQIEPPPPFGTAIRLDFLRGMGQRGHKFVLLLDLDRILSAEELSLTREVSAQAASAAQDG